MNIWESIGASVTHLGAGVGAVILFRYVIEPWMERRWRRKELQLLSCLFPLSISDDRAEMHFKCSLKPSDEFRFDDPHTKLFNEFFGRNPPTYRKYVHSAEVLALQKVTDHLAVRGVSLLPDAFYAVPERATNLLLIGSSANLELSGTIEAKLKTCIEIMERTGGDNGHKYFHYGTTDYSCKHSPSALLHGLRGVTEDCGVIVRWESPEGRVVLLLAGIHMHGTLAAAEVSLNPAFQRHVQKERRRSFAQLVRAKVTNNGTSIDQGSVEWKNLPFVSLD